MEQLLVLGLMLLGEYIKANDFEAVKKLWRGIERIKGPKFKGTQAQRERALAGLLEGMARDRASATTSRTMKGRKRQ